jgi:thymidylate synthase
MRVFQTQNNVATIMQMYTTVMRAPDVEIRGQTCRNIMNATLVLDGSQPILTNFRARNFNLLYAKKEWLWYLGADPFDDSIEEHAKAWKKLKQPNGSFYSNYGQYIFARPPIEEERGDIIQFEYVVKALKADRFTRRASMVLLKPEHLYMDNTDVVCTYAINFTIEGDALHMTVMMRSNDAVLGFTNDAFCFSMLMEFVYQVMSTHYAGLVRGSYTHIANSMHVYEKHYPMVREIVAAPTGDYKRIDVPRPTPQEVVQLVRSHGKEGSGAYTTWLQADF